MNYKDLLNRYKKGLVTQEEKQLVEEELDKQEAFEEYISERLDEEFNDITGIPDIEIRDKETTKLKKSVNNKLRKVVFNSVFIVILIYIGVFYILSAIVDKGYYDPTSVSQSEKEQYQSKDFYYDMQAYISLNMPGYVSNTFTSQESKGFGNYEVSYSLKDLFTKDEQRYFVDLSRGRLTHGIDGIFSTKNRLFLWEGFERIRYDSSQDISGDEIVYLDREIQRNNEETMVYLNELNPLSYISMSIVFNEDLTMEEFYDMTDKYPEFNYKWIGIRTVQPGTQWSETQPMHLIGFNPRSNDEPSSNRRPDPDKYPMFYLAEMRDDPRLKELMLTDYPKALSEAYGIHFSSRVKYLRDQKEFVRIFDYNDFKTDFYDEALKYIDENGVKTYGILVYGRADEFLEHIDEIPYDSIYINKVLPTKPNIYQRK